MAKEYKCPFCQKKCYTDVGRRIHVRTNHKNGKGGKIIGPIKKPKGK